MAMGNMLRKFDEVWVYSLNTDRHTHCDTPLLTRGGVSRHIVLPVFKLCIV